LPFSIFIRYFNLRFAAEYVRFIICSWYLRKYAKPYEIIYIIYLLLFGKKNFSCYLNSGMFGSKADTA